MGSAAISGLLDESDGAHQVETLAPIKHHPKMMHGDFGAIGLHRPECSDPSGFRVLAFRFRKNGGTTDPSWQASSRFRQSSAVWEIIDFIFSSRCLRVACQTREMLAVPLAILHIPLD